MSKLRISLIHPTGNPNSHEAALALWEANLLHEVITTVAYTPDNSLWRYLNILPDQISNLVLNQFKQRTWTASTDMPLSAHPWKELLRVFFVRTGLSRSLRLNQQGLVDWVYASLDAHVAKHHLCGIDAVYAYEDGAAATFQAAKQKGILCLYELPILFYPTSRDIQLEEARRFPELATALQAIHEPAKKLQRKQQEVQLADHIFVPSSMAKKSLLDVGIKSEKISVIPYGAPIEDFHPQPKPDQLFRALFVGREGPRKGVQYLLQAWQDLQLPAAELLLIGIKQLPESWLVQYRDVFHYIPSVPHDSLNDYYSAASVLVFPSLVEGFALVLLEAMACGIPVITTPNAGGDDLLTDVVEGFIVPIRDVEVLKEKLEWCYRHPLELAEMGRAARRKAEQMTWGLYRQTLTNRVRELLSHQTGKSML
jgi:starch synthase